MPLITFSPAQVSSSANVNANFGLCVLTDTSRAITVTHTYSATQTFTGGWTAGAACTISTGGIAVTGNSTITGSLSGVTNLFCGGITVVSNAGGAGIIAAGSGTATSNQIIVINTAAATYNAGLSLQRNSVEKVALAAASDGNAYMDYSGALNYRESVGYTQQASLSAVGILSAKGFTITTAVGKIIPGATSLSHRNNADSADNFILTDAGNATLRGNLTFASASTKIIPGATSIVFRNTADSGNVLSLLDNGNVFPGGQLVLAGSSTARASMSMPAGTAPTSPVDGDMWHDGVGGLKFRFGGVTKTVTWS